jgi:hypothetical protein
MDTGRSIIAIGQAGPREQHPEVVERHPTIHLLQGPLNDVLEVERGQQARTAQGQEVPPGIGREPPVLVGPLDAEGVALSHDRWQMKRRNYWAVSHDATPI